MYITFEKFLQSLNFCYIIIITLLHCQMPNTVSTYNITLKLIKYLITFLET